VAGRAADAPVVGLGTTAILAKFFFEIREKTLMPTAPFAATRRRFLQRAAGGFAGVCALGRPPAFAQSAPKKLVFAHIVAPPESSAVAFVEMAEAVNKQTNSGLEIEFHGGTLLTKELEVINAVKAGNIAIGDPGGAAATVFPEMGLSGAISR
jgi:TRAP-type C4-dicarboxylate transport system substrate-binding protein